MDENYLKYAAVMLYSLRINNRCNAIKVYLLYYNISECGLHKFEEYLKAINCELINIKIDRHRFDKFPDTGRWSIETYFRLMIPLLIKEDKVLYLDADIIVDDSLMEIYEMPLGNKIMAVCVDDIVMRKRQDNKRIFNAGVMLMNLQKMRQTYSFDDIADMLMEKAELFPMLDQDVLNYLYRDKVVYLDENRFNNQVCSLGVSDKYEKAAIYHYSIWPKPWLLKGNNVFQIKWNSYAEKCDFFKGDV